MKSSVRISGLGLFVLFLVSCMFLVINQQAKAQLLEKTYLSGDTIRIETNQGSPLVDIQLIENTDHCLVDCYAILKIHPYQDIILPGKPNSEFDWEFEKEKPWMNGLVSYHFEILKTTSYNVEIPEYGKTLAKTTCYNEDNSTYECETEQIIQTGSHEETRYASEYKPFAFWGETLKANQDYVIKLAGKKKAELGPNNVDWIPTIKGFELREWNWWNSDWEYKRQINVTDTSGESITDYPVIIEKFDCNGRCNANGSDLRVANDTSNSTVPFGLRKYNDTAFDVVFKVNTTGGGVISDIYLYYGYPPAGYANISWDAARNNIYDDFDGASLNSSLWQTKIQNSGTITVSSSSVSVCSAAQYDSWAVIYSMQRFNLSKYNVNETVLLAHTFDGQTQGSVQEYGSSNISATAGEAPSIGMFKLRDGVPNCGTNYDDYTTFKIGLFNGTHCMNASPTITETYTNNLTHYFNYTSFNQTIKINNIASSAANHNWQNLSVYFRAGNSDKTYVKCIIVQWVKAYIFVDPAPTYTIGNETFFDTIPPETTVPILKPDPARTTDDLLCNATLTDNKKIALTAYWKWYKNDIEHSSGSASVVNGTNALVTSLSSGNTSKGEYWFCEVTPYDGINYGSAKNSTALTILNSIPTHSNPLLISTSGKNFTSDNITCYNQSTSDPDSDQVTNIYNWHKNNQPLAVLNIPFENSTKDYSGKGNNGTLKPNATDGPKFVDGKTGKALLFDGKDDYVDLGTDASLKPQNGTYEAWVKINALPTDANVGGVIFENYQYYNGLFFSIRNTGKLHIRPHNGAAACTLDSVSALNVGEWYHVVGTIKGTNVSLYINGVFNGSATCNYLLPPSNAISRIGSWGSIFFFNGTIDEVKIYPYALTPEQIRQNYLDAKDGYTDSRTIVSQETTPGETYRCEVTPNDGFDDGIALNSTDLAVLWNITFNITNGEDGSQLTDVNIYCNNSWSTTGINSPYEHGFLPGDYSCTFAKITFFDKTEIFSVVGDNTINVIMSKKGALTNEEHAWLEWLYNCWRDGNCWNLLNEINQTTTQIWQRLTGTNRNVVIQENVLSYILNATSNITINYTIKVPYKEGVPVSELLPIRLYFWFTDVNRTKCYSQDKTNISNRAEAPYCLPLVAETLEPNNGTVTFTVDLRPALPYGSYNFTRSIEIDPFGIWTQYGKENLGTIQVLEDNEEVMINLIKTEERVITAKEVEKASSITGGAIGKEDIFSKENLIIIALFLNTILIACLIVPRLFRNK